MFKFGLGQVLKDIVTGFKGVVAARTEYLTGCNRYSLQSQKLTKENKPADWQTFDETVLVVTDKKTIKPMLSNQPEVAKKQRGGPQPSIERW